jgi:hypothetical protein
MPAVLAFSPHVEANSRRARADRGLWAHHGARPEAWRLLAQGCTVAARSLASARDRRCPVRCYTDAITPCFSIRMRRSGRLAVFDAVLAPRPVKGPCYAI